MAIALELPGSIKCLNDKPVDWSYGPFANIAAAKAAIPLGLRYDGLTVQITGSGNFWWLQADLTDLGLVAKGIGSLTLSTDELPKSSGGTLVHSGIFSTAIGNLDLGFGLSGTIRNVNAAGSASDIDLQFNSKGLGTLILVGNSVTIGATTYGTTIGDIIIQGNQSSLANTKGGTVKIFSGQGNNGNASSGDIFIDTLAKTGSGIVGSISIFKQSADYGLGEKVIFIGNATTNPSTNPTGGGIMFVKSTDNKPYWRTPAGIEKSMVNSTGSGLTFTTDHYDLGGALTTGAVLTGSQLVTLNNGSAAGGGTLLINATYTNGGLGILAADGKIVSIGGNLTAVQTSANPTSHLVFTGITTFGANNAQHNVINISDAYGALNGGFTGTTLTGIYYNLTGVTVANHYAMILATGKVLFGGTTITPGSVLVDLQSTTLALLLSRVTNIASVATPVNGMTTYDAATNLFNFRQNGSWITLINKSLGAVDNAIVRVDGTGGSSIQDSSVIISDNADLTIGSGIGGSSRTLTFDGSSSVIDAIFINKGIAKFMFNTTSGTTVLDAGGAASLMDIHGGSTGLVMLGGTASKSGVFIYGGATEVDITSAETVGLRLYSNQSAVNGTPSGNVKIYTGAAVIGNADSGNILIDIGAKAGSGKVGNMSIFNLTGSFGAGEKIIFINNATTVPSSNPTGGGIMYVEAGALKFRGSSGTVTTIAPA